MVNKYCMSNLYHNIYENEIFVKSRCIWHENTLLDLFRSILINLGYSTQDPGNKVWKRGEKTVVVCLVDDFSTCSTNYSALLPYLFDSNTTVITDNYITCPTQYKVFQLPSSFFGIYAHTPEKQTSQDIRRFNFSVNRLDAKRLLMFLEIQTRAENIINSDKLDYINFNCWSWDGVNDSPEGFQSNFQRQFEQLESQYHDVYGKTFNRFLSKMPFINHGLSHEQAHASACLNVVMETYSSDTTVALSEKIFKALCIPTPWIVYSGKYTVAYLRSLGFDVMPDVIEHKYDNMIENKTAAFGDKMVDFIFEGVEAVESMTDDTKKRCVAAAEHNQQLLYDMQQKWPADFAAWLPEVIDHIK